MDTSGRTVPTFCTCYLISELTNSSNGGSATNKNVLVGYCGGTRTTVVLDLPEDRLIERVVEDLGKIIGEDLHDKVIGYKISRWDTNPYILGSLSYHPVSVTMKDRVALAKPIGRRLFWTGEATATNENYATVHGAIESGMRVAEEVRSSLLDHE